MTVIERFFQLVEETWQGILDVVADRQGPGLREDDWHGPAIGTTDGVSGVVLLDELPGALDRRGIDDRVQHVRTKAGRVGPHRLFEAFPDGQDPAIRQLGILTHEKAQQVVEIPE